MALLRGETVRTWTDENTGREVRQLTSRSGEFGMPYFRASKHLCDGRLVLPGGAERVVAVDVETGEWDEVPLRGGLLRVSHDGQRLYSFCRRTRDVWALTLPAEEPVRLGNVADERFAAWEADITQDGGMLLGGERIEDAATHPPPWGKGASAVWQWYDRPRSGSVWGYDLRGGRLVNIVHLEGACPILVGASPTDPELVMFFDDHYEGYGQRIWTVRRDGSQLRPIRRQQRGELITHEFWWPDGQRVAYKYQDRRNDATIGEVPWAEYSPVPTQFGLSDLSGEERYLSDPLERYHSHINASRDCRWLSGEGTDGYSFVCAAAFSAENAHIDFVPLATIHSPYVAFAGQGVSADFSPDGRWLLYNDTVDGEHHVCAVRVDL